MAGANETLERVRAATVCFRGVCPVLEDTRRELGLPLLAPPETSMDISWRPLPLPLPLPPTPTPTPL